MSCRMTSDRRGVEVNDRADLALPLDKLFEQFHIKEASPLGGRLNQHWLINFKNDHLVLRRWYKESHLDEIDYEVNLLKSIAELGYLWV